MSVSSSKNHNPCCVSRTLKGCVTYTSHFCFPDVVRHLNTFHLRKKGHLKCGPENRHQEYCSSFPLLCYAFCFKILKALSLQWNCTEHVNKWHPGNRSGIGVCLFRQGFQEWGSMLPSTENSVYHFGDAIKITNVQSKPNSLCYLVFEIHKYVKQKTSNRPFYPGNSVHIIFLSLVQKLPRELLAHPSSI